MDTWGNCAVSCRLSIPLQLRNEHMSICALRSISSALRSAFQPARLHARHLSSAAAAASNPTATFNTSKGEFKAELMLNTMPITCSNFIDLAQSSRFDGVHFDRVVRNFMFEFGCARATDPALPWQVPAVLAGGSVSGSVFTVIPTGEEITRRGRRFRTSSCDHVFHIPDEFVDRTSNGPGTVGYVAHLLRGYQHPVSSVSACLSLILVELTAGWLGVVFLQLSMVNTGRPNTGGSRFFINTAHNNWLDWFNDRSFRHRSFRATAGDTDSPPGLANEQLTFDTSRPLGLKYARTQDGLVVLKKFGPDSQAAGMGIDQGAVVAAVDGRRVDHDEFLEAVAVAAGRGGTIRVEFSAAVTSALRLNGWWKVLTSESHRSHKSAHRPRNVVSAAEPVCGNPVFGKVTEGMDVVMAINTCTTAHLHIERWQAEDRGRPFPSIIMESVTIDGV